MIATAKFAFIYFLGQHARVCLKAFLSTSINKGLSTFLNLRRLGGDVTEETIFTKADQKTPRHRLRSYKKACMQELVILLDKS
jgi:hypothetical protein